MGYVKRKFTKLTYDNKDLLYFILFFFLLQNLFFVINYSDLNFTLGVETSSFFSFFVFFSTSLSINLIYFIFLSIILTILGNFRKLSVFIILFLELVYSIFIYYDIKIYKILGVHLYNNSVLAFLNKKSLKNDILMKSDLLDFKTILYFSIIMILTMILFHLSKKASKFFNFLFIIKQIIAFSLLLVVFSLYANLRGYPIISVLPFYDLFENDINLEWITPNYPNKITEKFNLKNKPNIVLLLSESTRSTMFTKELMPNITSFVDNNSNCITSKHNFSGAHTTFPSLFSILFGIYGYNNLFFNNQVTETEPITLKFLKENGYQTIMLTASSFEASYGIKKLMKFFDIYKFFKYEKNGKVDINMINWFENYYQENLKNKEKPFFVIIFMRSPHYAYDYPKKFEKYKPTISLDDKNIAFDSKYMSKKYKKQLFNRYKNSILFIDDLFKKITVILKPELDKNNLILFYTGDHGEEFWEHGKFGHFNTSFVKEKVETPLLFCLPEIDKKNFFLTSSIDFFPTVIDYLTNQKIKDIKKYFDGVSLLDEVKSNNRSIIISTHSIAGTNSKMALVNKYGKLNIKYSSKKISKVAKFRYYNFLDFNDKIIKDKKRVRKLLNDLKIFEYEYTRFIKFK